MRSYATDPRASTLESSSAFLERYNIAIDLENEVEKGEYSSAHLPGYQLYTRLYHLNSWPTFFSLSLQ